MSEDTPPVQSELEQPMPPVLEPGYTYASVTDKISAITLSRGTPRGWWLGFGLAFLLVMVLLFAVTYLLAVALVFGASIFPWPGASPLSILSGGLALGMPGR